MVNIPPPWSGGVNTDRIVTHASGPSRTGSIAPVTDIAPQQLATLGTPMTTNREKNEATRTMPPGQAAGH